MSEPSGRPKGAKGLSPPPKSPIWWRSFSVGLKPTLHCILLPSAFCLLPSSLGLCVERSVEMIVGLLGILKAGGAYVPLDPTYPAQRLSYMLDDSQLEVLLTQQELLTCLPSSTKHTVCLDIDWGVIEQYSQFNPNTLISSDNLAYVIYTSGSTGKPKGTCIIHQGVVRLVRSNNYAQLSPTEVFLQLAPISFDASTFEIWGSLLNGAKLVVFPTQRPSLQELGQVIKHYQITTLWLTAGLFHLMVHERLSDLKSLSQLLAGGDVLSVLHVQKVLLELKNCQLINGYGPTENTTFTCCYSITQTTQLVNSVPIGRAIANTQVYILDHYLQPVPIGVIGEIYIGGDGLARGYLHRPELTAEKFIPNPFHPSSSPRLYRTGDLGRYLPDGNIEFTRRIDHQVKIRGFRIELGEIEAVLSQHPVVLQSVVIAREDIVGDKRLVAYIVVKPKQNLPSVSELRSFLKEQLPEYMIPVAFVTLDTIPLTPNGKIDRKALPISDSVDREEEYIAPRTPSEEIIANIFASVLGIQYVGIHDNFFTLGGHSLLATQLISRLRLTFTVEIPLRTVFESPTVAQLDKTITQLRTYDRGLTLPPIQPIKGDREQLPLSWAQERLLFLNRLEGPSATYNIPAAVRITGNLDINALQQALSEIVRRHEILRTNFLTVNGIPRQVIHPETTININMVDLQQLPDIKRQTVQKQLAREEATTPFSLESAPLIRCRLLHLATREYVLLLTMHHIVSDGWSMGVFFQELSALYPAFCAGVSSPLPELPLQYADFAVWQRQWLSGGVLETQLNYWRTQLHGAPSLLQLPTDHPRPSVQTYRGRTQRWTLNTDLTQKLQTLSAESGTTLFMTLYAAFATLLYCYSGQSDILIGSPIANRNRSEIEPLIGFFVNTLVLKTRFEANFSFKSLLAQVRETTLQAYEHQDVPFEQVVEALQPQRSLSHSPLFQVMFVLQNAPIGEVELPGVTWCQLDESRTVAKFDLTLSMTETSQGLVGEWEYNTDLFDGSTIERMAGHFQNLLSAIVENPVVAVDELPLLSAAEHHQLLREWNDTTSVYATDKCIHQLFEQQVHLTPDAMPLTPNGKVDRRALPAPDTSSFSANNGFVQPRNPTEEILAGIWAQILALKQIGIHDNFFEVGGHSLLGMQLISQASLAFGVEIPLRLLFEKQTIALFSQAIEALADSQQPFKTSAKISPLPRKNHQPEYFPLSGSQHWSWIYDHPYTTTMKFTYYIVGSVNVAALEQSLNEIVRRHDILRANFPVVDGKPVQVIAPTLTLTIPVINLRELSGTEKAQKCAQLFEQESLRPFDLENDPLLRTQLLQVGQQEYLLNFFINHIIFDGFSLGVFMEEFSVLYNAFNKGLPYRLTELPFQFVDFVHWQQQFMSGELKDIYDDYWKNKLANAQPIFEPSRELEQLLPALSYTFELSTNLINSLREMARKKKVSLFIIMLTAFKLLLHTYTGKNDIVVGVMNANRNPYETKCLIGFFANRLLLRTHLDGNPSFRELLIQVCDLYFESYDYQSLPGIHSGIAAIDHAQVMFNFIPVPRDALYPPIEQSKLVNFGGGAMITEHDLNLNILDEEDRVHGRLIYTNRLFDAKTIEYLVNLYRQILEQAVEL
jgi:amino acid adenylation domain-containing protein